MKRFFSLLTVFVLALSLAVPVGAAADYPTPSGKSSIWKYYASMIVPDDTYGYVEWYVVSDTATPVFTMTSHDANGYNFTVANAGNGQINVPKDGVWVYSDNARTNYTCKHLPVYAYSNVVYTCSAEDANSDFICDDCGGAMPNLACDGTSCPATDLNIDGICDDCGMMLSLRSLTYPAFPSVDGANKHYALVKTKYSGVDAYMYSAFTSDVAYDIRGEAPGTVYQIAVDGVADYIQYVTTDGQTWVEIQNSSVNNQSVGSGIVSQTTVISSTFDWYNEEGEHFFPAPLWEEVQTMTQGEVGNLATKTAGTLKVLVPCGVGLMACLVVLSLFGKRSLISLR